MNILTKKSVRIFNWAKGKLKDHAIVLGYHRITKAANDPYYLNVSPDNFSEQLEIIGKLAKPVSLEELLKKLEENKLNGKYIAVTFDDGYSDNFYRAKPLLEKHDVPATAFVSAGKLNSEFWWDTLERLVLSAEVVPEELRINYKDNSFFWKYNEKDKLSPNYSLFYSLYMIMQNLHEFQIREILNQLMAMMDKESYGTYRYRAMSEDELLLLSSSPLIQIGSHTMTHANLRYADSNQLKTEIYQSKKFLEQTLGKVIPGFSYPNGGVTSESSKIIRDCGYKYACISFSKYIFNKFDRYSLPRLWAPDLNGEKFEKWLTGWRN